MATSSVSRFQAKTKLARGGMFCVLSPGLVKISQQRSESMRSVLTEMQFGQLSEFYYKILMPVVLIMLIKIVVINCVD